MNRNLLEGTEFARAKFVALNKRVVLNQHTQTPRKTISN